MGLFLGLLLPTGQLHAVDPSFHAAVKKLKTSHLLKFSETAKQLVDSAYQRTQDHLSEKLRQEPVRPGDLLLSFKQPVGKTREAVRAADCLHVALALLEEELQKKIPGAYNVTNLLTSAQLQTLYRATGCGQQEMMTMECNDESPYRTITGECNNKKIPSLGASNRPYARWLLQQYEDGVSLPRGWTESKRYSGFPLPLVRKVSNELVRFPNEKLTKDWGRSVMFMQWGQFIDHDMDFGPGTTATLTFQNTTQCGLNCVKAPPCFPIQIPPDDSKFNQTKCMPFTRAAPACNGGYAIRNQINAITPFIDASMVYASEVSWANDLRNLTNNLGLLAVNQMFTDKGLAYLPFGTPKGFDDSCKQINPNFRTPCFLAGDNRVNEMPALITLHTLFLREHNRLARELKRLNPELDGETIYQEARKIMGAAVQIITFKDYLPLLLGSSASPFGSWNRYRGYNDSVDPRIASVFTNAFRMGHAQVRNFVFRLNSRYQLQSQTPLQKEFFATWRVVHAGGIDPILRGMISKPAKLVRQNQLVVEAIRDHLFEQVTERNIGLDLPSLNMQRGRDHGLPGYNDWRQFCGLSQPRNEDELAAVLQNRPMAKKFIQLYGTPNNIDLWIGGLMEPLVRNGRVGPLFSCIFKTQFQKLRDGDRFWWQNPGVFTPQQRQALNRVSLSRIICDNTHIREVPRSVFRVSRYPRNFISCNTIPRLSLFPWKVRASPLTKGGAVVRSPTCLTKPSESACELFHRHPKFILGKCIQLDLAKQPQGVGAE
ncbi:eosinophil peroxidase-like [Tiliqua scincoides]|uniref:eosinophil peroxidase-like n=1 Tax=Tiliqua scincoides TaxID=71010 RepID=UPI00346328BD